MNISKTPKQTILSLLTVITGNFLYALTVSLFLLPAELVTGGTTGIALVVSHFFSIPVSGFVLLFNLFMLVIGWLILGKTFALTTIASTFLYPVFLELCEKLMGSMTLTEDPLLCTIFSGLGIGISLGLVIRAGASTGGMDIPPLVLNQLFRIPVSVSLYVFDIIILLLQALIRPTEYILYGILLIITYTIVLDKMLLLGSTRTEVKLISSKPKELCDAIQKQVDRGVTLLHGEGGYLHNDTDLLLSVISNRELIKVEKLVHKIDPACFMIVSRVSEVKGRGFSMNKEYQ